MFENVFITFFESCQTDMFKVSNRNTRTGCEICSKLTIKTPGQHHLKRNQSIDLQSKSMNCSVYERRRSRVFIVNFEHISHLVLPFLLLTLSR